MRKRTFQKKTIVQAAVLGAATLILILLGVSQRFGIGQTYQSIVLDDTLIGYTAGTVDVKQVLLEARRELAAESDDHLCMDYEWETGSERKMFQQLLSEDELKDVFKETLKEKIITTKTRVYTVAIDGYRANFTSLDEVCEFLDRVKAASDENGEYRTEIEQHDSHIGGILEAKLMETTSQEDSAVIPEQSLAESVCAGVNAAIAYEMNYALANPTDNSYQTGILDMEFVENVEVYQNYVDAAEVSDMEEELIEVTKEKESNKIYVVEGGDCLSVIAMDHDTTVSSIVALNGLSNANAIREGQELIIAVPEPDLKIRITMGEVYEEDYNTDPIIIDNDTWYTTKEVVLEEGTTGHRERNDVVVYENGMEVSRDMIHQTVIVESKAAVIERGTVIPPTYIKPLAGGRFTSGYGKRWGRMHKGVDWACPVGTTVYASSAGTVIQASYNGGYGYNVVISHPDGRMTRYAHNSKLLVSVGQHVEQGETIALSGNTGRSTGPHVHFEIYIDGSPVNPLKYIGN